MAVQINVAANQAALTASIQAGVQAYNQKFAQNNQINLSVNQRAFSQPLGRMTGDVKDFEAALAASNARVIAFGASTAVLGGVIRSFKELANVTIDVEKNLADINRVFGLSTSQLQKFSTDLFSVGKQTASTFDDASKAALEFSRQGLKAEDVLIRTKDALTLARVAGISTANSVDALTSTVNGFAATGVTTSQILNKLVAVEQDFAVGAGDLAEALSRTGQAAQEAGVSLDQLNALVTAAQQSTARGGAVIGNALKTIFTRLQRTETLDQLEAFNIAVRDVQGNTLPAVTVLQNFAGAYKNLGDAQRAQLSEQVAGVYQVNILKAIVGDLNKSQGVYAGALQRGASATNEAEVATAKLNQTLDALLKQTATSTQQLANNIGKVTFEPLARYGTEQLKSLVESMNEILEGEGVGSTFANGLLKGIRNIIAGPGAIAAFFTLFKLIQNSFTYLAQALPQIAGITTETQNRKNIEQSILQIMQQQGPVSQALAGAMGNQAAQAQLLLQLARQQTAEYQIQSTLAKQLATQLAGQGVRVKGSGGLQATRAGGYIPNATRMAEAVGAQAGGYAPGKVVKSPVGGVMNTAEDVKYVPGFAQPFINPPAGSKAGRAHRQNAISRTGVDPYTAGGFIPNFAKKSIKSLGQQSLNNFYDVGDRVGNTTFYDKYDDQGLIKTFNLPFTYEEYRSKAAAAYDNASKIYKTEGVDGGLANANKYLKEATGGYSQALEKKYFDEPDTSPAKKHLNKIAGGFGEKDTAEIFNKHTKLINAVGPDFKKIIKNRVSFIETKVRKNDVSDEVLLEKFLRGYAKTSLPVLFKRNGDEDVISAKFGTLIHAIAAKTPDTKSLGFIPNFAPPTSAMRVPWFKKFGNASFDAVQPTLGISKANDTDTFRSSQFRSKAFEKAATDGDPNLFAPLYEDFVFKALQLTSQSKIKDQLIRGYVNQPGTNQKQSAYDAFLGDVALEDKGFPKQNLTGSISKNLNDKFERYAKANPAGAAKIKEAIMIFNEVGHENQIPSEFGKNFTQLAGTSYSQMLKNSPDLVKGLSAETNSLLNNYVKNPAFLAMNAAKGFVPNFADPKIKINSGKDAVESFYRKGSEVDGKKLTGGVMAFPVPQTTDLYSVGSSRVSIPGSGFGIPLYDAVLAEVSKRGAWLTSDRLTVSDKARRIWDGYRKLRTGDVKNKKLPMKNWFLDPAFNNGSYEFPMNPQDLLKNKSTWPSENDPVWSLQHAYQFKKSQLNDKMSSGFIPNFASMISSSIKGKGNISAIKTGKNDYEIEGVEVGKKFRGQGLGSQLYGNIAQKIGSGSTIKSVLLPQEQALADYASGKPIPAKAIFPQLSWAKMAKSSKLLINGKEIAMSDFESGIATHKYNAAKLDMALIELVNSHASGFIPNFANQDFEILREIIRLNKLGAISNNRYTSSEEDDKNNITRLYRGVKGISERWNSIDKNNPQAINKAIFEKQSGNKIMNEKEFVNKSFSNLAFSHRLNWPDETENPIPFLSTSKKEDVADMFAAPSGLKGSIAIKNSRLLGNERRYENLYKKYGKEKVKGILYKLSKTGGGKGLGLDFVDAYNSGNAYKSYGNEGEIGLFSRGFIPNLANFIDVDTLGKNSVHYSGDLMKLIKDIESSIGRHLTSGELRALTNPKANLSKLNDPKVLNKFINSENKGGFAGFAKGFLPNFAYKQAVMGLEESMSGNKAVFDSKPFPHIRNKSQPTFSSAIADHGGLSNALSDSMRGQKNAGLMNRGFIPNFVNPQLSESKLLSAFPTGTQFDSKLKKVLETLNKNLNKLATDTKLTDKQIQILERNTIKCANYIAASGVGAKALSSTQAALSEANKNLLTARKEEVQNKNKQRLNQVSTTLAFAGPIVAGLVEQVLYGNKQRFEMTKGERVGQSLSSTGLTSLSTGASLGGSIGGLPGAIVGSLLGLGVAIMSASQAAKLSAEELQSLADQTKSTTQNTISFGNAYIEALKTFQTSTDPEIIKKASISLADSFQAIVDINLQKQFKDAGDDISKLSKILFEYETSKKQITKLQEERALVQQLKPAGSELLNEALGNSAPAKEGERKRTALLGTSNKNEIDTALVIRFSGLFSDLSKLNQTQIQELQKTILENAEDANKIFEKISSFADKDNQALFSLGQSNEISQVIAEMQGSNFGAGKGLTGKIPADISFYTNLYRKKSASPNKLDPQQIQDQAYLSAAYKDLLQSTILQVGFENDSFKLIQERAQIEQDYLNFLGKNLEDKKGVLEVDYQSMKTSLETKKKISLKEKESSIIQDYLKFFETAPANKRSNLEDTFITQQAPAQKSFIEKMPQTRLEFEKTMQENMGTNYNKENLNALYEATQKYRQENEYINDLNKDSLVIESRRFDLAKKRLDREQSFLFNLKSGYASLTDDGKELTAQLGRNLPRMFADGLVDGIKAAIKESDNLGQALMGIAAKFLDEISTIMMRSSIYQILGSFLPSAIPTNPGSPGMTSKQKGGYIRAQSGMYISGTGSGDKYPAMLENGEYVLNRRAVMAMGGPSALDSLNFSAAPRFAAGGSFGNDFNDISSMESNMTTYGLEQSQLYNELRDSERQKQAEGVRKRQKRKAEQRALIGSVIAAVATAAIAAGVSNVASNIKTEGDVSFTEKMNAQGGPKTEAEYFKQQSLVQKGIATPSMPGVQSRYTGPTPQTGFASIFSGPTKGQTWYQKAGSAISKPFGKGKKQTGGLIGSRLSDTIPGYMEGGLYSSPMVKKYGTGMQNGGSSVMAAGNNGSTVNNNTNASNSFNFNTSVQRDGKIEIGSNSTSYVQQDVELSQSLNTKVYEVVLDTIRKEKRFGGSLAGARNA